MEKSLPLPETFEKVAGLNQAEAWPKWYRRFKRYRTASGLSTQPNGEQVSTLLYAVGDCADDIIITQGIDENTATYDNVAAFEHISK